ncbi:hypothetical protein WUBG_11099 [Wuchereria bancrofti]|uniref:Uncharacterized protein n=1 Tax=Wuchereria bancrofti TaxID=6293 RepID=J9E6R5_WUCBA|nr:hypothetical protein WUBG_11099 [Wuchereria bancrofti]
MYGAAQQGEIGGRVTMLAAVARLEEKSRDTLESGRGAPLVPDEKGIVEDTFRTDKFAFDPELGQMLCRYSKVQDESSIPFPNRSPVTSPIPTTKIGFCLS